MYGLRGANPESERLGNMGRSGPAGSRRRAPENRRMAGDALNLDLKQSLGLPQAFSAPITGLAELRTPELPQ